MKEKEYLNPEFVNFSSPLSDFIEDNLICVIVSSIYYFSCYLDTNPVKLDEFDPLFYPLSREAFVNNIDVLNFENYDNLESLKKNKYFYNFILYFFIEYLDWDEIFRLPNSPFKNNAMIFIEYIRWVKGFNSHAYVLESLELFEVNYNTLKLISDSIFKLVKESNSC